MIQRMDDWEGSPCLNIVELALSIEYTAYDLYRTVAESISDENAKNALLTVAQAEKGHMRTLAALLATCPDPE